MSIAVRIDGQPAEQLEAYRALLGMLGPIPDESQRIFDVWTRLPQQSADAGSVWLNPPEGSSQDDWHKAGGATLQSSAVNGQIEDRLRERGREIREREIFVRSRVHTPLDPVVLAAFLAHDFPLVDALMLARAFRGQGWPNDLSNYPIPVGAPRSDVPFAGFPRNAGLYAVVPGSEWVRRLAELNTPVVQLRDKRNDPAQRALAIRQSIGAVENRDTLLFINDDWRLAIQHGAYGVHLGQEDMETADLDAIRKAGLRLGISTHGIYEMLRAYRCRPSYMALGAIYATATKTMPTAPQGLRRLKRYVELMAPHYPLVAIGGIDLSRAQAVLATGVDCIAVLRAVTEAEDPAAAIAQLKAQVCAFA